MTIRELSCDVEKVMYIWNAEFAVPFTKRNYNIAIIIYLWCTITIIIVIIPTNNYFNLFCVDVIISYLFIMRASYWYCSN